MLSIKMKKYLLIGIVISTLIFSFFVIDVSGQPVQINSPQKVILALWSQVGNSVFLTNLNYKLGIGTDDPTQKLEVNGGVRLNTDENLPSCDEDSRGTLWFKKSPNGDTLGICKYTADGNVIIKSATLPEETNSISCAEDSSTNKIYCFGWTVINNSWSVGTDEILEYDPSLDLITIKSAKLPLGDSSLSCVENSDTHKIYCFGGFDLQNITEYDPISDTVTIKSTNPVKQYSPCAEDSSTNKIYCFGGSIMDGVVEYNPSTDQTIIKNAVLPFPRDQFTCTENSATNKIYCFGGSSPSLGLLDEIIEYNPSTDQINIMNSVYPFETADLSCSENSATNKIYCFGGVKGFVSSRKIVEFIPLSDSISTESLVLPDPLAFFSCVENSATNKIYCFGGNTGSSDKDEIIEHFKFSEYEWKII